jgi:hypothetical protein
MPKDLALVRQLTLTNCLGKPRWRPSYDVLETVLAF